MTDTVFIDGTDVFARWGVFPTEGFLRPLAEFPLLKPFPCNIWHEFPGEEADLSRPLVRPREVVLPFAARGGRGAWTALFDFLTSGDRTKEYDFRSAARTVRLRFIAQEDFTGSPEDGGLCRFNVRLGEDTPGRGTEETLTPQRPGGVSIDGVTLETYGLTLLGMSVPPRAVKPPLTRDLSSEDGLTAFPSGAEAAGEMVLKCLLRARTVQVFWQRRDALLYDLLRPGARLVRTGAGTLRCYYVSARAREFFLRSPWMVFDLRMRIIGPE